MPALASHRDLPEHELSIQSDAWPLKWSSRQISDDRFTLVEFRKVQDIDGVAFDKTSYFVCSRHRSGGVKNYEKNHSDWNRQVASKGTDCPCTLRVKSYLHTPILRGSYQEDHNHKLGPQKLCFTRVSSSTRERVASLLHLNGKPEAKVPYNPLKWLESH